ncbi:phosphoenolpyruvate--protein phosphotransferase [Marinospirillum alkaliphilum]|uniref:phosphoenolpyruvate--protein phosphotransferase n=1 Tax=Marinospirillum alkaliphilum DSM 21637 TaxID=1122209 RepID=A0A1K1W160_9GAMM|nr:phosphoenolpyruvate--protein phosphotransferase [Marinospirillum alkaliphilum]SFX30859.1 phosphotransferase system, enzyme I, PtsP [Marinospirillum alkaliphilum DSM 21637]
MLDTLRKIVQEVSAARDLQTALSIIVRRVRKAMNTDVCSVYLMDPRQERYVLMNTLGLNASAIGHVSLAPSEGLVGYVGQREEPLNLDDAPVHPRYRYLPETGEERYHSFLGVPIIHQRHALGVLVVQQKVKRRFDEGEEAFLVTIAAQLAAVLAHAQVSGSLQVTPGGQRSMVRFDGLPAAPGVAIGRARVIMPPADLDSVQERECDSIEEEKLVFLAALRAVREDIRAVGQKLANRVSAQEQALFEAYLQMLDEESLGAEVLKHIEEGQWAQGALAFVVKRHVKYLEKVEDSYLRERAADIRDLGRRVLAYLQAGGDVQREYEDNTLLVGEELSPTLLGEVPREKLAGLISVKGSSNSHLAILARAMGIPTVMGLSDLPYAKLDGQQLILDGYRGQVISNPDDTLLRQYERFIEEERALTEALEAEAGLPCVTRDGHRVPLMLNTGLTADHARALAYGAEGVGLYRTEVQFMLAERFPSEMEQVKLYREQLSAFSPREVTMRTLDIGGDKPLPYFPIEEENPCLGWRGIRFTLDHPEVFLSQVRAMLRASEGLDNLRILLPMISSVREVEEARALIRRAWVELRQGEGLQINKPLVGAMIEVPAALFQIPALAERVDYLSVGSNDLTQYLLAVDRDNPRVARLYSGYHPAVLHALARIAADAHACRLPVSICGELAGDPAGAVLLLGMGYQNLSMNLASLPRVKAAIRRVTVAQSRELLEKALGCASTDQVVGHLGVFMSELGLGWLSGPKG